MNAKFIDFFDQLVVDYLLITVSNLFMTDFGVLVEIAVHHPRDDK